MEGQTSLEVMSAILNGGGISILTFVALYATYKKITKPTAKKARRNIKRLVSYLETARFGGNNGFTPGKPLSAYSLQDVSLLVDQEELKWGKQDGAFSTDPI